MNPITTGTVESIIKAISFYETRSNQPANSYTPPKFPGQVTPFNANFSIARQMEDTLILALNSIRKDLGQDPLSIVPPSAIVAPTASDIALSNSAREKLEMTASVKEEKPVVKTEEKKVEASEVTVQTETLEDLKNDLKETIASSKTKNTIIAPEDANRLALMVINGEKDKAVEELKKLGNIKSGPQALNLIAREISALKNNAEKEQLVSAKKDLQDLGINHDRRKVTTMKADVLVNDFNKVVTDNNFNVNVLCGNFDEKENDPRDLLLLTAVHEQIAGDKGAARNIVRGIIEAGGIKEPSDAHVSVFIANMMSHSPMQELENLVTELLVYGDEKMTAKANKLVGYYTRKRLEDIVVMSEDKKEEISREPQFKGWAVGRVHGYVNSIARKLLHQDETTTETAQSSVETAVVNKNHLGHKERKAIERQEKEAKKQAAATNTPVAAPIAKKEDLVGSEAGVEKVKQVKTVEDKGFKATGVPVSKYDYAGNVEKQNYISLADSNKFGNSNFNTDAYAWEVNALKQGLLEGTGRAKMMNALVDIFKVNPMDFKIEDIDWLTNETVVLTVKDWKVAECNKSATQHIIPTPSSKKEAIALPAVTETAKEKGRIIEHPATTALKNVNALSSNESTEATQSTVAPTEDSLPKEGTENTVLEGEKVVLLERIKSGIRAFMRGFKDVEVTAPDVDTAKNSFVKALMDWKAKAIKQNDKLKAKGKKLITIPEWIENGTLTFCFYQKKHQAAA